MDDIDIVCVIQTTLRGTLNIDGTIYNIMGKGGCKMVQKGGGVGIFTRKRKLYVKNLIRVKMSFVRIYSLLNVK